MKRYECFEGGSSKFWEIEEPFKPATANYHIVRVKFGRIGSCGQTNTKAFSREQSARDYYNRKISKKLGKGYTLNSAPAPVVATPKPAPVKKACEHVTLNRKGSIYTCFSCGDKVEFNEPQANVEMPEFETKVRRFFDLSGRANA